MMTVPVLCYRTRTDIGKHGNARDKFAFTLTFLEFPKTDPIHFPVPGRVAPGIQDVWETSRLPMFRISVAFEGLSRSSGVSKLVSCATLGSEPCN